jgi:OTU domain-containing protein 3
MVLNACPGTNIRKVRRLLKRYHGDVNKVIDKLYEEVQVVIESLDTAIIHPLETSQIGGSVPVESVKNHNMEDQQQEDSDALKIDQEVTEDNMNEDDKEDKGDKDYSPENGTDEEQEEPEKKNQDKEPAEKKQKKPSASERKKEAKRKQKEAKLQKEREKAARKAKYKQEAVTAESNTEHDKPVTTTHSMKEMYI